MWFCSAESVCPKHILYHVSESALPLSSWTFHSNEILCALSEDIKVYGHNNLWESRRAKFLLVALSVYNTLQSYTKRVSSPKSKKKSVICSPSRHSKFGTISFFLSSAKHTHTKKTNKDILMHISTFFFFFLSIQ